MHPPTSEIVASNIRAELARQRISQRDLAEKLGRSVMFINRRVTGEGFSDLDTLDDIAAALGVSRDDLLSDHKATA